MKQNGYYQLDYFLRLLFFSQQEMRLMSQTPVCSLTPGDFHFSELTFKEKLVTCQD